MAKKKSLVVIQSRLENLPVREAVGLRRGSVKRGKSLIKALSDFRASDIADQLGISRQKYSALKKQIKAGKIASPDLNRYLEQARDKLVVIKQAEPHDVRGKFVADHAIRGKREFGIDFIQADKKFIGKNLRWARNVKPGGFASLQSALNWYGNVTGGNAYFWIASDKKTGRYFVYDIRTAKERGKYQRGKVGGKLKARKFIQ